MHTLMFEKITGKCIFYCSSVEKKVFFINKVTFTVADQ